MWFVLAVLACLSVCNGENFWYKAECSEKTEPNVTFKPSNDGVRGRYVVRCCTAVTPLPTQWTLRLRSVKFPPEKCNMDLDKLLDIPFKDHSFSENKLNLTTSCSYVCLSQTLDLIYQSCYWLINSVSRPMQDSKGTRDIVERQHDLFTYINNSIPRYTKNNTSAYAECYDLKEKVICTWLQGTIPYTEYLVSLIPGSDDKGTPVYVTENCTRLGGAEGSIRCELAVPPGAYTLELTFVAPWTRGTEELVRHKAYFNYTGTSPTMTFDPQKSPSASPSLWWIIGVCVVLAASLLTGLMVYQKRVDAKKKLKQWQEWLASKAETDIEAESKEDPLESSTFGVAVLLLYARDCAPAQRVATALLALLKQHHSGQVFDLYSPEVTARAAKSPAAFVRECMTSPHVIVVLLQTPALAALHTVRLADVDTLRLEEPLLPARVMYRKPMFGDTLLQYALQLMRETQPSQPYRKYKLATLSALSVDAFPSIVPYTRYALPADGVSLARSLAPRSLAPRSLAPRALAPRPAPAHPDPLVGPLAAACDELVEYVTENPNYLAEQIMFL